LRILGTAVAEGGKDVAADAEEGEEGAEEAEGEGGELG
jgi:hypothetical protein